MPMLIEEGPVIVNDHSLTWFTGTITWKRATVNSIIKIYLILYAFPAMTRLEV